MEIPGEGLWSLAISPDGQTALTDTGIGSMLLWDLETGEQVRGFERPDQPAERGASGMAFNPDGRRALSCDQDGAIIEWELETGKEIRRLGLHPSLRTRVVIHPDGTLALTSGMDGSLKLWDLETGELIRQTGERGVIFDLAVSPDGLTALYGSSDTMVYLWRLAVPTGGELQAWIQANRYVDDTNPVR
jgi:WD40 repeat protein